MGDVGERKRRAVDFEGFPEEREAEDEGEEDGDSEEETLQAGCGGARGFGISIFRRIPVRRF